MEYTSPDECRSLIQRLPTLGADEGHTLISTLVSSLLRAQASPAHHLEVLESARDQIARIQAMLAKRYASHPLPPDSTENATLARVVSLWQALARSYAHIAREDGATGALGEQRSLLAQRAIHCSGLALLEYFRAHRALPARLWTDLHAAYVAAETAGVAGIRVADPLVPVWKAQSPAEAYIGFLLVDLANPFARNGHEFAWISRWAQRFAPYCALQAEARAEAKSSTYGLDLSLDKGLRPLGLLPPWGPSLRSFDSTRLASQIKAVLSQLRKGATPDSLGLGDDCPFGAGSRLLLSLYRPWGLASSGRRFPRRAFQGTAQLCGDWLGIGFHVQGKPFAQPSRGPAMRSVHNDIAMLTLGERVNDMAAVNQQEWARREAVRLGFVPEAWAIADHSVAGFRLESHGRTERLEHRQLVGIRPPDGERFLLAQISWLMYREDGVLEAGVQVMTGLPRVVAVRQIGLQAGLAYQQGFILPPTPALKMPASLVIPGGWFQPQRIIEIFDAKARQLRLTQVLLHGTNFDQVSFEEIELPVEGARPASVR